MTPAELSVVARTCESCGAPIHGNAGDGAFANLCTACNALAAPETTGRHAGRLRHAERSARCRATNEPRVCPYCSRHHQGNGLARHLFDVHRAAMFLVRLGHLSDDDPQADGWLGA